jgi:alkylhydroperoxidase family enzyme
MMYGNSPISRRAYCPVRPAVKTSLDELEIADVIHGAAFFNWANRLMLSLGEPTPAN